MVQGVGVPPGVPPPPPPPPPPPEGEPMCRPGSTSRTSDQSRSKSQAIRERIPVSLSAGLVRRVPAEARGGALRVGVAEQQQVRAPAARELDAEEAEGDGAELQQVVVRRAGEEGEGAHPQCQRA